jgi:hypothetical protein
LLGDNIRAVETGRVCSKHGREQKCIQNLGVEILRKDTNLEDIGVGGIILKWVFTEHVWKAYIGFIDCETRKWWAIVSKVK